MDEQEVELRKNIAKTIQHVKEKQEVIDEKIKNNDYKIYDASDHDKMTLINRKMILKTKLDMLELREGVLDLDVAFMDHLWSNSQIIGDIIKIISQDSGMSSVNKEKALSLLNKLKPKKLTINTGLVKAEWYDDLKSNS
ncbi:MAG: hypothetical protein OER78_03970 [Nitrosopumilus sp.]|nr:hypothetical protein [Nitrosopumilus sp.]